MARFNNAFNAKMHKVEVRNQDEVTHKDLDDKEVVVAALDPFYATRSMFRRSLDYTGPMSYEEWKSVSADNKAAVLFVQFFDQITLAWYKTKSFYVVEEDGVSTMLQYLMKNVPLIEESPAKFTPAYIYKVAYNCLYCISHDIKRDRERFDMEISNLVYSSDEELDLFDTVVDNIDDYEAREAKQEFWSIIEDLDISTLDLVDQLINSGKIPARMSAQRQACLDQLRRKLEKFNGVIY